MLEGFKSPDLEPIIHSRIIVEKPAPALALLLKIMDQARRRVISGEKVAASKKLISFFQCHTDIIEKRNRETTYAHKVFPTWGGYTG